MTVAPGEVISKTPGRTNRVTAVFVEIHVTELVTSPGDGPTQYNPVDSARAVQLIVEPLGEHFRYSQFGYWGGLSEHVRGSVGVPEQPSDATINPKAHRREMRMLFNLSDRRCGGISFVARQRIRITDGDRDSRSARSRDTRSLSSECRVAQQRRTRAVRHRAPLHSTSRRRTQSAQHRFRRQARGQSSDDGGCSRSLIATNQDSD